jgi:para-nitrobenzyl esterase
MDPMVTVAQGQLRGREKDGVRSFLGIPYADEPFGERRFAVPAPARAWSGIREATEFGATAPKPGYAPPIDALLPDPQVAGQGCLNLNVWTPQDAADLPVLVWIHGGAFVNGSGAVPIYDGTAFARDGVVCVSINYRLGVDGFGAVTDAVPNRGLLDQVAALTWVRDNIAQFGGDPGRVTIAGESAGAMSIGTLLSMPLAEGLFRRAILQSGAGHHTLTPATAGRVIADVAHRLGVEPTASGLGSVPVADLVAAQAAVSESILTAPDPARWAEITVNLMAFEPIVDGDIVPQRPIDAIVGGASADIEVLVGSNLDEHALFLVPNGFAAMVDENLLRSMLPALGADAATLIDTYRSDRPDATPGELMTAIYTDWFFRLPAVRLAEARSALGLDTHSYEFAWRSPQFDGALGACHALEIGFTFDNLADPQGRPMTGDHPPQALADSMHAAWVSFIREGRPGWPPYGAERNVMRFDETNALVSDPRPAERSVWAGIR